MKESAFYEIIGYVIMTIYVELYTLTQKMDHKFWCFSERWVWIT